MAYEIRHDESKRESFAEYKYRIYRNGRLVARYWHDHRGDEHGIEFTNGASQPSPVGRMTDFIEGGGPQPLVLSKRAVAYLDGKLA
ncbi:MAG: hypothetical protein ACREUW_11845 [Burkholderiales bacterium]